MNFKKIIKKLKESYPGGYPHFSILTEDDKYVLSEWNQKFKKDENNINYKNHSEYLLIKNLSKLKGNIIIYQTHVPCVHCLNELEKLGKKIKIYFLFDPHIKLEKKFIKKAKFINVEYINKENIIFKELIDFSWSKFLKRIKTFSHRKSFNRIKLKWRNIDNIKYFM